MNLPNLPVLPVSTLYPTSPIITYFHEIRSLISHNKKVCGGGGYSKNTGKNGILEALFLTSQTHLEEFNQEIPVYLVLCDGCGHLMPESINHCWYCAAKLEGSD